MLFTPVIREYIYSRTPFCEPFYQNAPPIKGHCYLVAEVSIKGRDHSTYSFIKQIRYILKKVCI